METRIEEQTWKFREIEKCDFLLEKKDLKENEKNSVSAYKISLEKEVKL